MGFIWIIASYLIGSISFGLLFSQKFCNTDPRADGSNNVGATNVCRLCGKKWGLITLLCDVAKGFIPVWLVLMWGSSSCLISLTALAVVLGHVFPCFSGFRGGKAVATSIGVFLPLAFCPTVLAILCGLGVIWRTNFVSLGSLVLMTSLIIFLVLFCQWTWVPLALLVFILIIWTHRANIQRLICGIEKPWTSCKEEK